MYARSPELTEADRLLHLPGLDLRAASGCLPRVPLAQVVTASRRVANDALVLSVDTLASYDSYYCDRKHRRQAGDRALRLEILRRRRHAAADGGGLRDL